MMTKPRVLLVGWDGADWHLANPLIKQGRMPQLAEMVKNGASGPIESLPPYLSPMLWNTIATGHHPAEHGIIGFTEFNVASQRIQPVSSQGRRVKALWNILSQEDKRAHVFGWFASHPAEKINGVCVAETFAKFKAIKPGEEHQIPTGSVHPESAGPDLADVRVPPAAVDINLLQFFIPRINEVDLQRDPRPKKLLKHLSELYTLHNAAVATLEDEPDSDFLAIYYHFIDWICHDFVEYGAPQRPEILDWDFEIYSGVVEKAYELQDLLLRDLLGRVGRDAVCVIVSDHGFLSGDDRPERTPNVTAGIAAWHRPQGLVTIAGPGIALGARIDGARLFDVTPTILHAMHLPVGRDMVGQVLRGAFADTTRETAEIESWEKRGPALETFQAGAMSAQESAELLRQFADLGYIDLKGDPFETAEDLTRRENAWNLGQALLNVDRLTDALPLLEEARFHGPEHAYLAMPLARCQAKLGLLKEAMETAEVIRDFEDTNPQVPLLLAEIYRECREYAASEAELDKAQALGTAPEFISAQKGLLRLVEDRFEDAEAIFRELSERAPSFELSLGLVRALARQEKFAEAEPLVERLVAEHPNDANVWFTQAQLLQAEKDHDGAKVAYARALELNPQFLNASFNLTKQERASAQAQGEFIPFTPTGFDFSTGETRSEQLGRENKERLAALRTESAARSARWWDAREKIRGETGPQRVIKTKPTTPTAAPPMEPIIVVSGLPRSGTSLMMQMLDAAGLPLKTDDLRESDEHNPRGYFEWEPIKRLSEDPACIDQASGHVVKVVSSQIGHLPADRRYRVIWMSRTLEEIVVSQERMILDQHPERDLGERAHRQSMLESHHGSVLEALRRQAAAGELELIEMSYQRCLAEPDQVAHEIAKFLGEDVTETLPAMVAVIDRGLHRARAG